MKTNGEEKNAVLGGTLYLVGTPIGNLSDLSERAVKVLSEADFVAAEDTRVSGKLLAVLKKKKEMISYFEHNKAQKGEVILARLLAGESCALVTDAGMPAISDPGEALVALCAEHGVPVSVIPGPCAAVSALALSGLSTRRFHFEGFLPRETKERRERLAVLAALPDTLILYEAPHRLKKTLADLSGALGARKTALCREMTKRNEEILRTTLPDALARYTAEEPRGEFVLVIEGGPAAAASPRNDLSLLSPEEHVAFYEQSGMRRMDAIKRAAADRGVPKSDLYRLLQKEDRE